MSTNAREIAILDALRRSDAPLLVKEVAEAIGVDHKQAYKSLVRLADRNFVNRTSTDEGLRFEIATTMNNPVLSAQVDEGNAEAERMIAEMPAPAQEPVGEHAVRMTGEELHELVTRPTMADAIREAQEREAAEQPIEEKIAEVSAFVNAENADARERAADQQRAIAAAQTLVDDWQRRVDRLEADLKLHKAELVDAKKSLRAAERGTKVKASSALGRNVEDGEVIVHRLTRLTGATVSVYRYIKGDQKLWHMTCMNHGQLVERTNRLVAEAEASHPEQWCGDCRAMATRGEKLAVGKLQ